MEIRLPLECRKGSGADMSIVRTITRNVSTGGVSFELDGPDFGVGDRLEIDLTVPPAAGVSPYQGRASCRAEVLRVLPLSDKETGGVERYVVAAQFLGRLRLSY